MARRRGRAGTGLGWLLVFGALWWLFSGGDDREPRRTGPPTEVRVAPRDQGLPIEARQSPAEVTKPPPHLFVYVTGEVVNVRAGPSMDHPVIGQGYGGDRGEELGRSGGWVHLRLERNRLEGYMYGRYVARSLPTTATPLVVPQPQVQPRSSPVAPPQPAVATLSDDAIRQELIQQSIARYPGSCPCPYNVDRGGRRCGGRSAYSRPGGASPYCYPSDVPASAVEAYRQRLVTR